MNKPPLSKDSQSKVNWRMSLNPSERLLDSIPHTGLYPQPYTSLQEFGIHDVKPNPT
jgi:hypothetical protein